MYQNWQNSNQMNNKFEMKNNNNNKNEYLSTRQVYNIPNEKFNITWQIILIQMTY